MIGYNNQERGLNDIYASGRVMMCGCSRHNFRLLSSYSLETEAEEPRLAGSSRALANSRSPVQRHHSC